MNQQPRPNGYGGRGKFSKNHHDGHRHHGQTKQQEFKPVAILKRGETSTNTLTTKDENQAKENISSNGGTITKILQAPTVRPVVVLPSSSQLTLAKPASNISPPAVSSSTAPAPTTPIPIPITTNVIVPPTPSPVSVVQPSTTVLHRSTGPINLVRSNSSTMTSAKLTSNQYDQHLQSINHRLFSSSMTMKSSLKLIDENLTWCENGQLNNYLQDTDGFVVIGAIGREKVGKSTLLSLLGGNQFIDEDRLMIFPAASSNSSKITRGIDIYLTNEHTILLDTQPLLSSQLHQNQLLQTSIGNSAAHLWQQQIDPRTMFVDNILELQTLEIIAFILAVCHVVLVVEDQFADPYLYRLIQLAEILRPVLKSKTNEILRAHSPHLVFILNKCQNYLSPQEQHLIKRTLAQMMIDTNFQIYSSLKPVKKLQIQTNLKNIVMDLKQQELNENLLIKLSKENHSTSLTESTTQIDDENDDVHHQDVNYHQINAIFLPRRDFRDSHASHWQRRFLGFSNADAIVRQLRQQLLAIDRPHIEQCQSQRAWLNHASRIWDLICKSSQLADFSRLLT